MPFTPDYVSSLLDYSVETGAFTWKVRRNSYGGSVYPGAAAGTIKDGYVQIGIDGRQYRAHRLAWFVVTGAWPPSGHELDHINGVRSDNRWTNIRLVTRTQNNRNLSISVRNKSGYRGVSFRQETGKWHARITVDYRVILLGNFDTVEAAAAARAEAEHRHFGDHSFLRREA